MWLPAILLPRPGAGVKRIIYLGGLGDDNEGLSPHLRNRHEVGKVLRESGCVVVEFRPSIVIGSGSRSYELVRALVHHYCFAPGTQAVDVVDGLVRQFGETELDACACDHRADLADLVRDHLSLENILPDALTQEAAVLGGLRH